MHALNAILVLGALFVGLFTLLVLAGCPIQLAGLLKVGSRAVTQRAGAGAKVAQPATHVEAPRAEARIDASVGYAAA